MPISQELLNILACPKCKTGVVLKERQKGSGLICPTCKVLYPIKEDIPVMLIDEAIPVGDDGEPETGYPSEWK